MFGGRPQGREVVSNVHGGQTMRLLSKLPSLHESLLFCRWVLQAPINGKSSNATKQKSIVLASLFWRHDHESNFDRPGVLLWLTPATGERYIVNDVLKIGGIAVGNAGQIWDRGDVLVETPVDESS